MKLMTLMTLVLSMFMMTACLEDKSASTEKAPEAMTEQTETADANAMEAKDGMETEGEESNMEADAETAEAPSDEEGSSESETM